jgi:hypothetical protein
MTGILRVLNALGFAALPMTSISRLWVPLAFEKGMNVIRFLDIWCPGAVSSARWTKVLWSRASKIDGFRLRYTPALAQDLLFNFFSEFSRKRSTTEISRDNFSPVMVRKLIPNRFLHLSSHLSLALKSYSFMIIL